MDPMGTMTAAEIKRLPSAGLDRSALSGWSIYGAMPVADTFQAPDAWIQLDERHGIYRTAPSAADPMASADFGPWLRVRP